MWFMYGLKAQKLLAQGSALGIMAIGKAPCKGKSLKMHLIKMENPLRYVKLLPLQGARFATHKTPGRCPGLRGSAPSGRAAYMGFLPSGRAACSQLAGIAVYGNAGTRCCCPLTSRTSGGSDNFFLYHNSDIV